jgi:hypothetical protein
VCGLINKASASAPFPLPYPGPMLPHGECLHNIAGSRAVWEDPSHGKPAGGQEHNTFRAAIPLC